MSEATALDEAMDALDSALNWVPVDHDERVSWRKRVEAARSELSQLRARCDRYEDLALILRTIKRGGTIRFHLNMGESGMWGIGTGRANDDGSEIGGYAPDDGTGLPLLDAAAREAMKSAALSQGAPRDAE